LIYLPWVVVDRGCGALLCLVAELPLANCSFGL
jgi:hypothetical protein